MKRAHGGLRGFLTAATVAVLSLSMGIAAVAAPPGNSSDDSWYGEVNPGDVGIFIQLGWNAGQHPYADFYVGVWWGEGDDFVDCSYGNAVTNWSNDGKLVLDPKGIEMDCSDGEPRTVDVDATWAYDGKWGPYGYHEQGLQCKGKLRRDESPTVTASVVGGGIDISVDRGGYYEEHDGTCKQTGTPGNPQG